MLLVFSTTAYNRLHHHSPTFPRPSCSSSIASSFTMFSCFTFSSTYDRVSKSFQLAHTVRWFWSELTSNSLIWTSCGRMCDSWLNVFTWNAKSHELDQWLVYKVRSSCILSDLDCLVKSECCESPSPDINSISHRNSLSIVLVHSLEYCSCSALAQHAAKCRISSKIQEKRHPISSNEAQNIGLSYHSLTFPTDLPRCAPHIVSWPSEERHAVPQFLLRSFISFCAPTYFPQAGCFELLTDQPLYFTFPTLC